MKEKKPKPDKCQVCKKPIVMMVSKGTGFCSAKCKEGK